MKKNKNFLTRGEEAQREREEALKEYMVDRREQRVMEEAAQRAYDAGDLETGSYFTGHANAAKRDADLSSFRNRSHIEAIEKQYRRSVRTSLNSRTTREDIARSQYSTANYGAASSVAHRNSTSQIQEQIDQIQEQRFDLQQGIIKDSRRLSSSNTPDNIKQQLQSSLSTKWQGLESLAQQEGVAKSGLAIQKRKGLDTASVYESVADVMAKQAKQQIVSDVQSGKAGSTADINKAFNDALAKLTSSFGDLNEALHRTVSTEEEIAKQKKDIAESEKRIKDDKANYEKAEIQKEAAGGGGGRWRTAAAVLGGMGAAANAGGGIMRQWSVGREMDKMQLQTGYMDIANRRFFDSVSASQGDAEALARIRGGQHARSSDVARRLGRNEVVATGAEAVGGTLMVGATVAAGVAAHAATAGLSTAVAGGTMLGSVAGGIEQVSGKAAKLSSGATRSQAELAGYGADEALFNAQNRMQAFVNQNALDYTRNTTLATRGAGRGRGALLAGARDAGFMQDMANREIDQAGILSLMQAGVAGLGKKFRGKDDILRAGELSSAGLTSSPEEYMALRAAGEKGGVGASGLETILKNAVAAGLDNSKNIQEMMQGIGSIATVQGGVSTFGGAAENMALSVQSMMAGGMSSEMAIKAATDLNRDMSGAAGDRSVSVQNLVEVAKIQKLMPKADMATVSRLRLLKPDELKTISQSIGTDKEQDVKANFGIPLDMSGRELRELGSIMGEQAVGTKAGYGLNAGDEKMFTDWAQGKAKFKKGSPEELYARSRYNQRPDVTPVTDMNNLSTSFNTTAKPNQDASPFGIPNRDLGSDMLSATARGQVTANTAGQKDLEGNVATMVQAAKDIRPEAFREAISASSKELGGTLAALNTSIANLDSTVKALNGKLEPRLQTPNRDQMPNPYSGPKY